MNFSIDTGFFHKYNICMIKRTVLNTVISSLQIRPVILITGARQTGKSTLCREIIKELPSYSYVSLDDIIERRAAKEDPVAFLERYKSPLIIDEVQYVPELFEVIEHNVNQRKFNEFDNSGMYLLAGSESYLLMQNVTQSMAGRINIFKLPPLSVSEINKKEETPFKVDFEKNVIRSDSYTITTDNLYDFIINGMYPEIYEKKNILSPSTFYSTYVQSYIERDVSRLLNIKDKLAFERFLEVLASETGQELVYDNLAKWVGVKIDTIKSWISILLATDLIHLVYTYNDNSTTKRIVKRPKIYFSDTGLAAYLARIPDKNILQASRYKGSFVETYIVNEIRKSYLNNGLKPELYYYRDSNQNEIDLIILDGGKLHCVECKSGVMYDKSTVKAFDKISNGRFELGQSCILCTSKTGYKIKDEVYVLPISSI